MLTIAEIKRQLRYDPATGLLWWKLPKRGRRLDRPAGRTDKTRHVTIGIDYEQYMAHRVIWAMQTGKWPKHEIDHKNRKRADNRWKNLREATTAQNRWNSSLRSDNTSGQKGVSKFRNRWRARLYVAGKEKHLGVFSTKTLAGAAFKNAANSLRGEYAHG